MAESQKEIGGINNNMDDNFIVLAKSDKAGIYKRKFCIQWHEIRNWVETYFTKQIEIEPPHWTKILSFTEKGIKKLDKMPDNIILRVSQNVEVKKEK